MTILRRLRSWFLWIFQRQRLERSLDDDLQEYVEHSAADKMRDGISPEQARRAARMELGGVEQTKEHVRSVLSPATLDACMKDVTFALRTMASNRTFTALAVLCLALGIGANTTIFSFMDSILFRSLPVENPRSLVVLSWHMPQPPTPDSPSPVRALRGALTRDGTGVRSLVWPYPAFEMLRAEEGVFASVFGQQVVNGLIVDGGEGGLADGTYVTGEYFQTLGVRVIAGRTLTLEDDRRGAPPAIVLSSAFSHQRFGSAEAAIGRLIRLDNVSFTVVGVTPPEFFGLDPARSPDFFIPVHSGPLLQAVGAPGSDDQMYQDARDYWMTVAGRLRPGVSSTQAHSILAQRFEQFVISSTTSDEQLRTVPTLVVEEGVGGFDGLRRRYREPLYVLFAMVMLILAIASANIASLQMSRATARRREIAVRLSLGARRLIVIRQLLTESVMLALMGGAVGVGLSVWGMRFMTRLLANGQEGFTLRAELNWEVLVFSAAVSMLTGIVFGLAPAIHATRFSVFPALKGTRSTEVDAVARGRFRPGLGQLLVVTQIALSLVLVVGALLFGGTVSNLRSTELGFNRDGLLLATIATARARLLGRGAQGLLREFQVTTRTDPGCRRCQPVVVRSGRRRHLRSTRVHTRHRRSSIGDQRAGDRRVVLQDSADPHPCGSADYRSGGGGSPGRRRCRQAIRGDILSRNRCRSDGRSMSKARACSRSSPSRRTPATTSSRGDMRPVVYYTYALGSAPALSNGLRVADSRRPDDVRRLASAGTP